MTLNLFQPQRPALSPHVNERVAPARGWTEKTLYDGWAPSWAAVREFVHTWRGENGDETPLVGEDANLLTIFTGYVMSRQSMLIHSPAGTGKCLGRGTPVLMYNGDIKPVEEINTGDYLMGPDSKPRRVLSTNVGRGALFRITPIKGMSWVCNDVHVMTVASSGAGQHLQNTIKDIPLNELLAKESALNRPPDRRWKLIRTGVDWREKDVPINPWLIGAWLGDGTRNAPEITAEEPEIISTINQYAAQNQYNVTVQYGKTGMRHHLSKNGNYDGSNHFRNIIKTCQENNEKTIPKEYLINNRKNRLELLAGIIDTDGYLSCNGFEIAAKPDKLANQIVFLAQSLGFCVSKSDKFVDGVKYNRIFISGNTDEIPCRVSRKRAAPRKQIKRHNVTGWAAEAIGDGEYFGFTLDGDGRFLLGDFTITHNTRTLDSLLPLIPQEMVHTITYGSKKSLYSQEAELNNCMFAVIREVQKALESLDMKEALKMWGEGKDFAYQVTDPTDRNDAGKFGAKIYNLPCRPLITTRATENDDFDVGAELLRRWLQIYTDPSIAQTERVIDTILKAKARPWKVPIMEQESKERLLMHVRLSIERGGTPVAIPGAEVLTKFIPKEFPIARSMTGHFLKLVDGAARFNYWNRPVLHSHIIAAPADAFAVVQFFGESFNNNCMRRSEIGKKILDVLPTPTLTHADGTEKKRPTKLEKMSAQEISVALRSKHGVVVSQRNVNEELEELLSIGYVDKDELITPHTFFKTRFGESLSAINWRDFIESARTWAAEEMEGAVRDEYISKHLSGIVEHPLTGESVNLLSIKPIIEARVNEDIETFQTFPTTKSDLASFL